MFRKLYLIYFLFFVNLTLSQVSSPDFYREDQFYFSLYYNSIKNGVEELKENEFSSSLNFGFLRDIPLNRSGKFSLGIGVGVGFNSLNNNLYLNKNILSYLDNNNIEKNKFNYSEIQFPIEIRLRNSSIDNYRFWRLYAGLKYSRILKSKYKFKDPIQSFSTDQTNINRDQLGITLNIGFNTWNLGVYKSVKPFFSSSNFSDLKLFKVGLVFYVL